MKIKDVTKDELKEMYFEDIKTGCFIVPLVTQIKKTTARFLYRVNLKTGVHYLMPILRSQEIAIGAMIA